jgi:hypothetical protein
VAAKAAEAGALAVPPQGQAEWLVAARSLLAEEPAQEEPQPWAQRVRR